MLEKAVTQTVLTDKCPVAFFYDMTQFSEECRSLVEAFPPDTLHGFALKACPVVPIVRAAHEAGLGGECASIGEIALCVAAGIPSRDIIFDSPAKTNAHLCEALAQGVHINADNVEEIERIFQLTTRVKSNSSVGLRVNPQVGTGTIAATFTAAKASKFGVPLTELREQVIATFEKYPFLCCVHVHVGSQGCSQDVLISGAKAATDLAEEINTRCPGRVRMIDIGGGLSVDYEGDKDLTNFAEYAAVLRKEVPKLFKYRILTEFGRRLIAKAGWIGARVQHIKNAGGRKYIVCHAGADLLVRPVYCPEKWRHRLELRDANGEKKKGKSCDKYDVAGPLCFSGDIIGRDWDFPEPVVGDILVVRDAGAYTLGMYSRHTSQLVPPVYGYSHDGLDKLEILKKGETVDDLVQFWGGA